MVYFNLSFRGYIHVSMLKRSILLLIYFFYFFNISAQNLNFVFGVGGLNNDVVQDMVVDKAGNIYITGYLLGSIDFDPGEDSLMLEVTGTSAMFISKFNKSGKLIWAKALQSFDDYSKANCIELDDSNNIYLAGTITKRVDFDPTEDEYILTGGYNPDIFIAKYDSLCHLTWAFAITGSLNYDDVYSMKLDSENNIFITGFVQESMDFDPGTGIAMISASGITGYIAKYTSGGSYIASRSIIGADIENILIDNRNFVYLAGGFYGKIDLDMENNQFLIHSNGDRDWFLTGYDDELNFLWGFNRGNDRTDLIRKIVISSDKQIITTGTFYDTVFFDPLDSAAYTVSKGECDVFFAAYDTSGRFLWTKSIGGGDVDDLKDMLIGPGNDIFLTGIYHSAIDMDPGENNIYLPTMWLADVFLGQYDSTGQYLAAYSLRSTSGKSINALCSDSDDNLIVTGTYNSSIDLDFSSEVQMIPLKGAGSDIFLASYRFNDTQPNDTGVITFNEDLVKDINPGSGSHPSNLICFNNRLFFLANDGIHGKELWVTDGTEEGTSMISDINISGDAFIDNPKFVIFDNKLFFIATDTSCGTELWVYTDNPEMVKDINMNGDGCGTFTSFVNSDTVLFFTARDTNGTGLWRTNGTSESTILVKDINPAGDGIISELSLFMNKIFFVAGDSVNGIQLWSSDGTEDGTQLFKILNGNNNSINNTHFFATDTILYFTLNDSITGNELWISDGTSEGTHLIKDINTGTNSGNPANFTGTDRFVFFTANDSLHGRELWKTGGTPESTELVRDINLSGNGIPEEPEFIALNNILYFTGYDNMFGLELWRTDGYDSTTQVVANINPGGHSYPNSLNKYNEEIYFSAYNGNKWGVWRSREQGIDIQALRGLNSYGSESPAWITYCNGIIYFSANDGTNGFELWKYKLVNDIEIQSTDTLDLLIKEIDSLNYIGKLCSNCAGNKSFNNNEIKLKSNYYPRDATDTTMVWKIISGKNLATINSSGTIILSDQLSSNDTLSIELQTDDGSKLYKIINIISDSTTQSSTLNPKQIRDDILLYPNPVSDQLYIRLPEQKYSVDIYDISGRKQIERNFQNEGIHVINLNDLPAGLYLIEIRGPFIYRGKIIIE